MKNQIYAMLAAMLLGGGVTYAQDEADATDVDYSDFLTLYPDYYHGFRLKASQALIDAPAKDSSWDYTQVWSNNGRMISMQALFQPEYRPIFVKYVDGAFAFDTDGQEPTTHVITYNSARTAATAVIDNAALITSGTTELLASTKIADGTIDGTLLTPTMDDDGLMYVTCPSSYTKGGQDNTATEGGDIRIRFGTINSDAGRLGDAASCYVTDITGVYVTISAPTTVEIETHYTQAGSGAFKKSTTSLGDSDALGKVWRSAIIELGHTTTDNVPENLYNNIVEPQNALNSWNVFTFKRNTTASPDTYGYMIRFVDIVFKGVKAGEKVGWTNYQSLHDGYTPIAYTTATDDGGTRTATTTGIEEISANDSAPIEYFNLQGVRVDNPTPGLYIQRQGNKAIKVLVK
jgi:hypothetical protein